MIESFFEGFLLGVGAAVPLGAINILIMNTALKNYKSAVAIGFGAMSSDVTYLVLIILGMATFLNTPFFSTTLGILGSVFLTYMAYLIFKNRDSKPDTKDKIVTHKHLIKHYIQGYILTLVNPYTIVFWLSVAGYTTNKNIDPFITVFGMLCAIFLWITLMPYFVHRSKHRISQKVSHYISMFSALILSGFAISLFLNVIF